MRKLALAAALSSSLAACQTTAPTPGAPVANSTVSQVQAITTQVCSYVPTAQTVVGILGALGVNVADAGSATDVAADICAAVTKKSVSRKGARPAVHGVAVRGKFVRRR